MYGYDPILLENVDVNEWLQESEDNIILAIEKTALSSRNSSKQGNKSYKLLCLKREYFHMPSIKELFVKCVLADGQLMVKETYSSKSVYYNIGYFINAAVLVDSKDLIKMVTTKKNGNVFKINVAAKQDEYVNKEALMLSQIGLVKQTNVIPLTPLQKTLAKYHDQKNIPHKKEVYFGELLAKALKDYSYQWDAPVNFFLRTGEPYFQTAIFKQYYRRYGKTLDEAKKAVLTKILNLDQAFLEAAPRNQSTSDFYYRGMKTPFIGLNKVGDSITVNNFMSVSKSFTIALRFSGIPAGAKCCLYKIILEKGLPYVDMVTTTEYKNEKEVLLPRNLVFELVRIEYVMYPSGKPLYKIPIAVVKASPSVKDQFKIKTGCKMYREGQIEIYKDPPFIDAEQLKTARKMAAKVALDKDGKPITLDDVLLGDSPVKTKSGKCPSGYRRNKVTGLCELHNPSKVKKAVKKEKTPTQYPAGKLPKCPKGTRRNKENGRCEDPSKQKKSTSTKKPKCPKGTRRSKKTGNCELY